MSGNSRPLQKHHPLEFGSGSFGQQDQRRQGALSWLHISDIHFQASDSYSRKVVLKALVKAVGEFPQKGKKRPDLIFVTGDIAQSGQPRRRSNADSAVTPIPGTRSETVFKTIKSEMIWRTIWQSRRQADNAIGRYIDGFYNPVRRHSALGYKSPCRFEAEAA